MGFYNINIIHNEKHSNLDIYFGVIIVIIKPNTSDKLAMFQI